MRPWSPFWTFPVYSHLSILTKGSQTGRDSGSADASSPPAPLNTQGVSSSQRLHIRLTQGPFNIANTQATAQTQGNQHHIPLQASLKGSKSSTRSQTPCYSDGPHQPHPGAERNTGPTVDPLSQNLLFNQICKIREHRRK